MGGNTPTKLTIGHKHKHLTSVAWHLFLHRFDPQSIWVFLRAYCTYHRNIIPRVSQLNQYYSTLLKPVSPDSILYCDDAEKLEASVQGAMIDGIIDVETLTRDVLGAFLDKEVES